MLMKVCADFGKALSFYIEGQNDTIPGEKYNDFVLRHFSRKMRTSAYLWLFSACMQIELSLLLIYLGEHTEGIMDLVGAMMCAVISVMYFRVSKTVLLRPCGIMRYYVPIFGIIVWFIFCWAFCRFGILALIHEIFVHRFVKENKVHFEELERGFYEKINKNPVKM